MKVNLEEGYKRYYTIEIYEGAKKVIASLKEDTFRPADYAGIMARVVTGNNLAEVITATAETCLNNRVWDAYCTGSENVDVWIKSIVREPGAYWEISGCLTDIWQVTGDYKLDEEIKNHIYSIKFERC